MSGPDAHTCIQVSPIEGREIMTGVLTVKLNDSAARSLGIAEGPLAMAPSGAMAEGLRELIERGITRRGSVLTWTDSLGAAEGAPSIFDNLTEWECADSSFHIEDFVDVDIASVDNAPVVTESDQQLLLTHGLAFAWQFSRLIYALDPPAPVRCILAANNTNATFRFHQIRPDEYWNRPDLDWYERDKMIVLDIEPNTI